MLQDKTQYCMFMHFHILSVFIRYTIVKKLSMHTLDKNECINYSLLKERVYLTTVVNLISLFVAVLCS